MKMPSRLIDTHQHVWWHGRDDLGLIADMDDHGIEYAWLLSWEIPPFEDHRDYHRVLDPRHARADGTHAGIPLSAILDARERHPKRFVAGYCPHPAVGNAPALLEAAAKIHGVKVCGEWKFRLPFDDPRCIELYRKAGELKLPVVLHLDVPWLKKEGKSVYQPLWYGGTVPTSSVRSRHVLKQPSSGMRQVSGARSARTPTSVRRAIREDRSLDRDVFTGFLIAIRIFTRTSPRVPPALPWSATPRTQQSSSLVTRTASSSRATTTVRISGSSWRPWTFRPMTRKKFVSETLSALSGSRPESGADPRIELKRGST